MLKITWIQYQGSEYKYAVNGFIGGVLSFQLTCWGKFWQVSHILENALIPGNFEENIYFDSRKKAKAYCEKKGVQSIRDLFLDEKEDNDENINI